MSQAKIEIKVGLFVFLCIIILAVLMILFSKGLGVGADTKEIILDTSNIGGLRVQSQVLMSGVKIGTVSKTVLSQDGSKVEIHLTILKSQIIRKDAIFRIEQAGFLGDQYVAVYPGTNRPFAQEIEPNAVVHAEEPFNMQLVAADAGDLIRQMKETLKKLTATIEDVHTHALDQATLTNFAESIHNLDRVTASALSAVDRINRIIATNEQPAATAVSNLVQFSTQLTDVGNQAKAILAKNESQINDSLSNFHTASSQFTNLMNDVQSGKGLAGQLIENGAVAKDFATISSNLAVATGNLNRLGLWHWIFYKPKPQTNSPANIPAK